MLSNLEPIKPHKVLFLSLTILPNQNSSILERGKKPSVSLKWTRRGSVGNAKFPQITICRKKSVTDPQHQETRTQGGIGLLFTQMDGK